MPLTLEARMRRLLEATEMLHRRDAAVPFEDRVLQACRHLFPESVSSLELWDRHSGQLTAAYGIPYDLDGLEERVQRIGEVVKTDHPGYPLIEAGEATVMRLSEITTLRQFQKTELYDVAFKPLDLRHQVIVPVQTAEQLGGATINRSGSQDFTPDDLEIIRLFSRQMLIAHENELVFQRTVHERKTVGELDHLPLRRAGLTLRESEVLTWMSEGKRDREIATILGISYRTVTNHVSAILRKLGAETRTGALRALRSLRD